MTGRVRVSAVLVSASLAMGHAIERQQTFRSGIEAVQVDVKVVHRGKPVLGLDASNFELKDSGVVQDLTAVSLGDLPVNLLLTLDTSESVRGALLDDLRGAARAALSALGPDDTAAVLSVSEQVRLSVGWTRDRRTLLDAVAGLQPAGGTALYDGLIAAIGLSKSISGRTALLVFTDGADTTSWTDPMAILDAAGKSELVVYVVSGPTLPDWSGGPGNSAFPSMQSLQSLLLDEPRLFPQAFVYELADRTGGDVLHVGEPERLAEAFDRIVRDFKTRYLLTYSPKGVPATGWHPIDVRLKGAAGTLHARRGYFR